MTTISPDDESEPLEPIFADDSTSPPQADLHVTSENQPQRAQTRPQPPPGPGFWESVGWAALVVLSQLVLGVAFVVMALIWMLVDGERLTPPVPPPRVVLPEPAPVLDEIERPVVQGDAPEGTPTDPSETADPAAAAADLPVAAPDPTEQMMAPILARFSRMLPGMMLVVALFNISLGLLLCRYRLGLSNFYGLGWSLPSAQHTLIVVLVTIPLSALCTALLNLMGTWFPNSLQEMAKLFEGLRSLHILPLLILLAVGPAVGEELLFRGAIGRGLLSRYGWWLGIGLTSVLFGVVHMNLAQSVAVIPLGVAMHYVYAQTRSFWSPVLLHFLNNGFAAVMLKYGSQLAVRDLDQPEQGLSWLLLTASASAVLFLALWMRTTRARYRNDQGAEWMSPHADCGVPQPVTGYVRYSEWPSPLIAAVALIATGTVFWLLLTPAPPGPMQ